MQFTQEEIALAKQLRRQGLSCTPSAGHYVYDDTDTDYSEAPTYSWVELDPSYGGSGTDLGMAYDEMTNVALPFTFQFYGEEFNTIGICSNGNIGFGSQPVWEKQPRNTPIGAPLGPAGMAAAIASGEYQVKNIRSTKCWIVQALVLKISGIADEAFAVFD